jgi:hypothetical protein
VPRLTQVPEFSRRQPAAEADDEDQPQRSLPADDGPEALGPAAPAAPRHKALEEPWWLILTERFANDRRLLIGVGLALVALVTLFVVWPRAGAGVSVREIQKHPERWEGQSVRVTGRVGDVFPLGSGYIFNLLQGRDTIVVFTRTRQPESHQRVEVTGEVSAGYLDGRARIAILESAQP